jgi:porin
MAYKGGSTKAASLYLASILNVAMMAGQDIRPTRHSTEDSDSLEAIQVIQESMLKSLPGLAYEADEILPAVDNGVPEQSAPGFWHRSTLTGSWNGFRPQAQERGIDVSCVLKSDVFSNIAGGTARKTGYIRNADVGVSVDGENLFGWSGMSAFAHVISNNGGSFNSCIGASQSVSNIEAYQTTKLYELWCQAVLFQGKLSALIGLYDLNTEFCVAETAAPFLNSSQSIGVELSQTGKNGPSIFPNTALALRVRYLPDDGVSIQVAVLDGMPGSPDDLSAPSFRLDRNEGLLIATEIGYTHTPGSAGDGNRWKCALGGWLYTARTSTLRAELDGRDAHGEFNRGIYLLMEETMAASGISLFARIGLAAGSVNRYDRALCVGCLKTGLIPGRDLDQLGVSVSKAYNGQAYREVITASDASCTSAETAIEVTYRAHITPWLILQPDLQRVIDPETDPGMRDAVVTGFRVEVAIY